MDLGIRKAVLNLESYSPGKPIAELIREVPGFRGKRVIKLASNENPLGPSPKALKAVKKALQEIHRYPEGSSPLLREALAQHHGVSSDEIIAGAGGSELLRLIVETLIEPQDISVVSQWAFPRFRQHARLMGSLVVQVPMKNYTHDLLAMASQARKRKAKIIFIANPNNPTGTFNKKDEFERFLDVLGPKGPWVVHDEAYADFAADSWGKDYPQAIDYYACYPKLITLRTFSKIVGLAGLRVAYCRANPLLVEKMHRARLIFNVNSLAQAAAVAALKDTAFIRRVLRVAREGRIFLTKELEALGFFVAQPNATNFLFVKVPQISGIKFYEELLKEGVIVRPLNEKGLENFIRITIGNPSDNRALIRAIKKILH